MTSASLATNCVPTLGYASKGAACVALKAQGLTWREVGRCVGLDARAASSLATRTRQRAERSVRAIKLEGNVFLDLEREARRRGASADDLAADLLRKVICDKLYDAVLDT